MESSPDTEANGKGTHSNSDHSNFAAAAAAGTPNGSSSPSPPATSPPPMDERAEALKEAGNKLFSEGRYPAAIASYTAALEIAPSAALFCNRAFAHLKCENYGSAMADADAALALDGSFVKAYYRRASAKLALAKYKAARVDFKQVVRLRPADKDARSKLDECERAVRKQAFEDAIALEATKPLWDRLAGEVAAMTVDVKYAGPHLPSVRPPGAVGPLPTPAELAADETLVNAHGISLGFVKALMAEYKAQRGLPRKYSLELLLRLNGVLRALPSLVSVPFPPGAAQFNVCGDTHGQYYDTLNIFALAGLPGPSNPYLFNGDFVDRGSFSLENVMTLFAWKLLFPEHVHLTRGNHETKNMNKMYGFEGEVKAKLDETCMNLFSEVFQALPLGVVIDKKVFVVHGGLFQKDGTALDELAKIDRFREPPEEGPMSDMLWSDPQPFPGRGPSKRGVGQSFGPDVTERFLSSNGLQLLIRSHEVMEEGYQHIHGGKLITVFSAPNYCDQIGNKGAIVRLDAGCKPSFLQFTAVPHPPVKPMMYASGVQSMFGF